MMAEKIKKPKDTKNCVIKRKRNLRIIKTV